MKVWVNEGPKGLSENEEVVVDLIRLALALQVFLSLLVICRHISGIIICNSKYKC